MCQHTRELLRLEESLSRVVLTKQRNMRLVEQLASLDRETEDALQDRQLAIQLGIRDAGHRATVLRDMSNRTVLALHVVRLPHNLRVALPLRDVRTYIRCCDQRHSPSAEPRFQVEPDPPLDLIDRP